MKIVRRGNAPSGPFLILFTLLENYYLPGALEQTIGDFVHHYNHHRYHESIQSLTLADVYFGRSDDILKERRTKRKKH